MRRADRLFQIIQILRRSRRPVTAEQLAQELEVSKRSVYRDIADLAAQQVPVRGAAGLGYALDGGFDMPPLMLTPDEIEAAMLGAQWVANYGDPALADAARDLAAKISAVLPDKLRLLVSEPTAGTPPNIRALTEGPDLAKTRQWIREGRKLRIGYSDKERRVSERTIWPTIIGYAETVTLLASWCELRNDFRHFRVDQILWAEFLPDRHGSRPYDLRQRWKRHFESERGVVLP